MGDLHAYQRDRPVCPPRRIGSRLAVQRSRHPGCLPVPRGRWERSWQVSFRSGATSVRKTVGTAGF